MEFFMYASRALPLLSALTLALVPACAHLTEVRIHDPGQVTVEARTPSGYRPLLGASDASPGARAEAVAAKAQFTGAFQTYTVSRSADRTLHLSATGLLHEAFDCCGALDGAYDWQDRILVEGDPGHALESPLARDGPLRLHLTPGLDGTELRLSIPRSNVVKVRDLICPRTTAAVVAGIASLDFTWGGLLAALVFLTSPRQAWNGAFVGGLLGGGAALGGLAVLLWTATVPTKVVWSSGPAAL